MRLGDFCDAGTEVGRQEPFGAQVEGERGDATDHGLDIVLQRRSFLPSLLRE